MLDKSRQKLDLMKDCISQFKYMTPAIEMFLEKTGCHRSIPNKRMTNAKLRKNYNKVENRDKCYFCEILGQESHHYDYLKDKKVYFPDKRRQNPKRISIKCILTCQND